METTIVLIVKLILGAGCLALGVYLVNGWFGIEWYKTVILYFLFGTSLLTNCK